MRLIVIFNGCSKPRIERRRIELEFRDAMLDYCSDVERLARWQSTKNFEYSRAYWHGYNAVMRYLTKKERTKCSFAARFIEI